MVIVRASRPSGLRGDPHRDGAVEPAGANPCGQDHQSAKQQQRRKVNGLVHLVARYRAGGDEHDSDNKGDAGAVDSQARDTPERHPQVGEPEENRDEIGHCEQELRGTR